MKKFMIKVCNAATLFLIMCSMQFVIAQQTTTVTGFPTAAANFQTVSAGKTWVNPQNVVSLNNGAATVSLAKNGICTATKCYRSAIIQADHFGFNITPNDSIVGIKATVRLKASAINSIKELSVQVAQWYSGVGTPINKASNTFWPAQYQLKTFGGQNDTWNIWCCDDGNDIIFDDGDTGNCIINAPDFGLRIAVQNLNAASPVKGTIDYVSMTVYYISNGARLESQTREADNISESWDIFPNPVLDNLQLKSFNDVSSATVKIFNMQGQVVLEKNIATLNANETIEVETALLSKGVYLLQLISDTGSETKKFVKQ